MTLPLPFWASPDDLEIEIEGGQLTKLAILAPGRNKTMMALRWDGRRSGQSVNDQRRSHHITWVVHNERLNAGLAADLEFVHDQASTTPGPSEVPLIGLCW